MDWQQFFSVSPNVTIWEILNAPFVVSVITLFLGLLIRRDVKEAVQDVSTVAGLEHRSTDDMAVQEAIVELEDPPGRDAVQSEAHFQTEEIPVSPSVENFESQATTRSAELQHLKSALEKQLITFTERVRDGRFRRTFDRIRHSGVRVRARALFERDVISHSQYDAILQFEALWQRRNRSKGYTISKSTRELFDQLLSTIAEG